MKVSWILFFMAVLVCAKPAQAAGNITVDGVEYGYRPKKESYTVVAVKEKQAAGSKVMVQSEIGGSPVKEIGADAFAQGKKLQVYLPKSIKKIAKNAFGKDPKKSVKTLYCVKNSAAQKYAGKNKIPCKKLSAKTMNKKINSAKAKEIELALEIGEKYSLSALVNARTAAGETPVYSSDDQKAVTVSENGEAEAAAPGKAEVTVASKESQKVWAKVVIYVKPGAVNILGAVGEGKKMGMYWDIAEGAQGYEVWSSAKKNGTYRKVRTTKKLYIPCKKSGYYKVRAFQKGANGKVYGEFGDAKTMKKLVEGERGQSVKVRAIADAYVASKLGGAAQAYTYYEEDYQYQKDQYHVSYIRRLGKYITDDTLHLFITAQGEVSFFTAENRDKYASYKEEDIDKESLAAALEAVEKGRCGLDDIRITLDEKTGKLMAILPKELPELDR